MKISGKRLKTIFASLVIGGGLGVGLTNYFNNQHAMNQAAEDGLGNVQSFIVFTGSVNRICVGGRLAQQYPQTLLHISGVQGSISKDFFQQQCDLTVSDEFMSRVSTDRAVNTLENAILSSDWLYRNRHRETALVTSTMHMDRSYLELSRRYNGKIVPAPVDDHASLTQNIAESVKLGLRLLKFPTSRTYQIKHF